MDKIFKKPCFSPSLEHPPSHLRQILQTTKKIFTPLLTTLPFCSPIKAVPAVRSRRMHRKGLINK